MIVIKSEYTPAECQELAALERHIGRVSGELGRKELCDMAEVLMPTGYRPPSDKTELHRDIMTGVHAIPTSCHFSAEIAMLDLIAIRNWAIRLRTAKR